VHCRPPILRRLTAHPAARHTTFGRSRHLAAPVIQFPGVLSRAAAYVKRLQGRGGEQEKALGEFELCVGEQYASQEFLNNLKREITDSLRDLGRRIDHVFHPNRD